MDLGAEWHFALGAATGMTLFRKDVSSFIVPLVIPTTRDVLSLTTATVTIPGGAVPVQGRAWPAVLVFNREWI